MWDWQNILVYVILGAALYYLLRKFIWPAPKKSKANGSPGTCGEEDCGCH